MDSGVNAIWRRPVLALGLALTLLTACAPAVDEAELPAVPAVNIDGYQPSVRAQLQKAQALFDRKPLNADANGSLGKLYRGYRNFDAADALFARARALAPRNLDWTYYHAEVLEQKTEYAAAKSVLQSFLQREPRDLPARLRAARLQMLLNENDAALEALEALYAEAPKVGDIHVAYAQALAKMDRHDDAIVVWENALEQFGSFKIAHYALAQAHRRDGDAAKAEKHLWMFNTVGVEEPPAFDPRMAELFRLNQSDRALVLAAQAAKRKGDSARALALLEQALARHPQSLETRSSLVMGYAAESKFEDAERHIEDALALDPDHVELGLAIARVRLQQGQLAAAQEQLLGVTARSPKHAASRAWLGRTYELGGATAAAEAAYAQAFSIDPQDLTTRRFYSRWVLNRGDAQHAATVLEAMTRSPARDEAMILGSLAQVLARVGRHDDALAALTRAIDRATWQGQSRLAARLQNQRATLARTAP